MTRLSIPEQHRERSLRGCSWKSLGGRDLGQRMGSTKRLLLRSRIQSGVLEIQQSLGRGGQERHARAQRRKIPPCRLDSLDPSETMTKTDLRGGVNEGEPGADQSLCIQQQDEGGKWAESLLQHREPSWSIWEVGL